MRGRSASWELAEVPMPSTNHGKSLHRIDLASQVKQRAFDGAETLAKVLILDGLLKISAGRF